MSDRYHEGFAHGSGDGVCASDLKGLTDAADPIGDERYDEGYIDGFMQGQLWQRQEQGRALREAIAALGEALLRATGIVWLTERVGRLLHRPRT